MQQLVEFFANHTALFAALLLVLTALTVNEVHGTLTGGKRLGALEAVRMINDRDPIILDVRPLTDYKKGHLLNAVSLPLAKLDEGSSQFKDKARPIVVYCLLGGTSRTAAEQLKKKGYAEVYPLRGGMNAWLTANLPVTLK